MEVGLQVEIGRTENRVGAFSAKGESVMISALLASHINKYKLG